MFVSLFNLLVHGTGIWLETEEPPKSTLQGGETTKLKVSVTNSTPYTQGIVLVNTYLLEPDNCTDLNILDSQHKTTFIPRRSADNMYSINLEAIDPIQKEQTCEIEVELIVNENKIGSKFFTIDLVPK